MGQLFAELKRRNVIRVGIAYAVVGWVLAQVGELAADNLAFPDWFMPMVLVILALGFPVALIIAWAFELTPEGLKTTKEVDRKASVTPETGRKLDRMIIMAMGLAVAFLLFDRFADDAGDTPSRGGELVRTADASIAVLPFVNLSSDPEQEYFTDGISEELLNVLAKIPELHVAARTSSFQFKGENRDITDIGRQLGVSYVLEGSVRKSGIRIRITAQLIATDTGFHLWSETYDRELEDIFAVQDEISAAIVAALSETLGLETAPAPQVKAAANAEAYNAYLLGQHLIRKRTKGGIEGSVLNFERAIELDPNYAPAHAALGLAWRLLMASSATYGTLTLEESLGKAMPHIERALALDPDLADAHGVMGLVLAGQAQVEKAVAHYEEALRLNPSLTNVRNWYSSALGSLGRESEAFEEIETAYRLDPLSLVTGFNYANQLLRRRRFDALEPVLVRLDQIEPAPAATFRGLALIAQHRAADGTITLLHGRDASPGALRLKAAAAGAGVGRLGLGEEALRLWPFPDGGWPIINGGTDYERTLEMARERYQDDPDNPVTLVDLAWAYFNAGNTEQAEKMAARHLNRLGAARRPIAGTNYIAVFAAWAEGDEAAMLERLAPLEANSDAALDAGIDVSFLHWIKAQAAFMRGQADQAYEHAERALSLATMSPDDLDSPYRHLGWDEIPRFVALRERYQAYLAAERLKFLAVACGDDGFESWQPLPKTCAALDQG